MQWFLLIAGLAAGFVDSIAGGGGLISLPSLALAIGPGPASIGTNKIAGTAAALVALAVYARKGHFDFKRSLVFAIFVGLGSFAGSRISPLIPTAYFRWFLLLTCPLILWVVLKKDLWIEKEIDPAAPVLAFKSVQPILWLTGLACGLYDGIWGPGGGTFMFLSLFFVAKFPLLGALAAAKFANTCSAGVSLLSYAHQGFVQWHYGIAIGIGISIGAFFGSQCATKKAAQLVRPVLVILVLLLMGLAFSRAN